LLQAKCELIQKYRTPGKHGHKKNSVTHGLFSIDLLGIMRKNGTVKIKNFKTASLKSTGLGEANSRHYWRGMKLEGRPRFFNSVSSRK